MSTTLAQRLPMRQYRLDNIEKLRAYDRERYKNNKAQRQAYTNNWRKKYPAKVKASVKAWGTKNPDKKALHVRARHSRIKQAAPSWLSKQDRSDIRDFYKACPKGHHVDHIIPLKGTNVSGLHVLWNLQYLSAYENYQKGNKHE